MSETTLPLASTEELITELLKRCPNIVIVGEMIDESTQGRVVRGFFRQNGNIHNAVGITRLALKKLESIAEFR